MKQKTSPQKSVDRGILFFYDSTYSRVLIFHGIIGLCIYGATELIIRKLVKISSTHYYTLQSTLSVRYKKTHKDIGEKEDSTCVKYSFLNDTYKKTHNILIFIILFLMIYVLHLSKRTYNFPAKILGSNDSTRIISRGDMSLFNSLRQRILYDC